MPPILFWMKTRDEPLTPQIIPSSLIHRAVALTSPRGGRTELCSPVLKIENRTKQVSSLSHHSRIILAVKASKCAQDGNSTCRDWKWVGQNVPRCLVHISTLQTVKQTRNICFPLLHPSCGACPSRHHRQVEINQGAVKITAPRVWDWGITFPAH